MWSVSLACALENAWFRLTFSWQMHINLTDLCKHVYVICRHHMVLYRRLNTQGFGYPQHPTEHGAVSCANQGMTAWIPYTILQGANPSAYLLLHVLPPLANVFKDLSRLWRFHFQWLHRTSLLLHWHSVLTSLPVTHWPIGSLVISLVLLTRFLPSHFGDENTTGCVPSLVCDMPM